MRITGGQYRGRVLQTPKGKDVRPTTDKVRQAIFNIINSYEMADEPYVLDGFCGTGALGLEALSRFARGAVFIDKHPESLKFCGLNIDSIGAGDRAQTLRMDVSKAGIKPEKIEAADLLFLDPPYRKNLLVPALQSLSKNGWLADGALCVFECEKDFTPDLPPQYEWRDDRVYGECKIIIARYK